MFLVKFVRLWGLCSSDTCFRSRLNLMPGLCILIRQDPSKHSNLDLQGVLDQRRWRFLQLTFCQSVVPHPLSQTFHWCEDQSNTLWSQVHTCPAYTGKKTRGHYKTFMTFFWDLFSQKLKESNDLIIVCKWLKPTATIYRSELVKPQPDMCLSAALVGAILDCCFDTIPQSQMGR